MENLQIITNSITPAKVDFNYKQIEDRLDIVLDKYKGLVFTEETVADCKRTMADLRKGQRSLDAFRKDTKKKLTESVVSFENDCKTLYKKFDEVIDPLKEQADYYEVKRREDKGIEVKGIIDDVIQEYELDMKRGDRLEVKDGYLIASISIKKITQEIEDEARILKEEQDQEELDLEFITETVNKCNKENNISLISDSYTTFLQMMDISKVIAKIYEDTNSLVQRKIEVERREKEEKQRLEAKKELERIIEEERLAEEERLENIVAEEIEIKEEAMQDEGVEEFNINNFNELPKEIKVITKVYKVNGTAKQIEAIESIMNAVSAEWEVL